MMIFLKTSTRRSRLLSSMEIYRVLKDNGTVWYNHKPRRAGFMEHLPTEWIMKSKLNLYNTVIWNMKRSVNHNVDFTTPTHEYVYQLTKGNRAPLFFKKRLPAEFRSSVWTILPERVKGHPCVSQIGFVANCVSPIVRAQDFTLGLRFAVCDSSFRYFRCSWLRTASWHQLSIATPSCSMSMQVRLATAEHLLVQGAGDVWLPRHPLILPALLL